MSMTTKEREHLQSLLGPVYRADKYAYMWGGYKKALETLTAKAEKPKAKKKATKKKAAKK